MNCKCQFEIQISIVGGGGDDENETDDMKY